MSKCVTRGEEVVTDPALPNQNKCAGGAGRGGSVLLYWRQQASFFTREGCKCKVLVRSLVCVGLFFLQDPLSGQKEKSRGQWSGASSYFPYPICVSQETSPTFGSGLIATPYCLGSRLPLALRNNCPLRHKGSFVCPCLFSDGSDGGFCSTNACFHYTTEMLK